MSEEPSWEKVVVLIPAQEEPLCVIPETLQIIKLMAIFMVFSSGFCNAAWMSFADCDLSAEDPHLRCNDVMEYMDLLWNLIRLNYNRYFERNPFSKLGHVGPNGMDWNLPKLENVWLIESAQHYVLRRYTFHGLLGLDEAICKTIEVMVQYLDEYAAWRTLADNSYVLYILCGPL